MNWLYLDQGQQRGPVSEEVLANLYHTGTINSDTLLWREGLPDWIPLREAKLEFPTAAATPPPLPSATNPSEAVCAECGKLFPLAETIRHGQARVCAACKPVFLQKLAEGARINTGEFNYASFGTRFGAKFVDGVILAVPLLAITFIVLMPMLSESVKQHRPSEPNPLMPMLLQLCFFALRLAYETFFIGKYGATPGKMVCKIKVVTADGGPVSYGRAACRCLSEILSGVICYIGYLMVLFDRQKRALHDHICTTRVISRDS